MFDVSFSELMVIGVVALIVIGPERLPRVARTAGHLLGRLQRYVNTVKADINREMHIEDLKRFEERVKSDFTSLESSVNREVAALDKDVTGAVTNAMSSDGGGSAPGGSAVAPAAGQTAGLVLPCVGEGADVLALRLDATAWERLISGGLAGGWIQLGQKSVE